MCRSYSLQHQCRFGTQCTQPTVHTCMLHAFQMIVDQRLQVVRPHLRDLRDHVAYGPYCNIHHVIYVLYPSCGMVCAMYSYFNNK